MNLLTLWNNTFVLALLLMTVVLTLACLVASRFRLSAATKNSILLPTLVVAFALPAAVITARTAGWKVPLPVLNAASPVSYSTAGSPSQSTAPISGSDVETPVNGTEALLPGERTTRNAAASLRDFAKPLTIGLLGLWAAGALLCFTQLGRAYHSLWRLLANAHPVNNSRIEAAARKARSALGLPKFPAILATERVSSPVAVGTPRHGWVIWPPDTLEQMPQEQLEHVLIHEGAHIAHRDTSLRLAQGLIAAIWWWHPLVHLLNRQISRTREELCDNAVLASVEPAAYGQTLLDVERPVQAARSPTLAVTLFPEHERLENRIRSLLNPRRNTMHHSKRSVLVTASLAGVAASMLAGATHLTAAEFKPASTAGVTWASSADRAVEREYRLSFEDASEPRHLDIDIKRGDILVTAYEGNDILVRLSVPNDSPEELAGGDDGFVTVDGQPIDFEVRQSGNTIELDANAYDQTTHVEVFVPRRINLTLDSYREGVIRVAGVEGHVRARSQNNDIFLTDVAGSADIYGYNGNLTARLHQVTGELEFDTYNGNIDLSLPADLQTTTYIRAEGEEVLSQLPIDIRPAELIDTTLADGERSIDFNKYVVGDINGGGSRTIIETTNGSVTIRKF